MTLSMNITDSTSQGQLREQINSGISEDDFKSRISKAISPIPATTPDTVEAAPSSSAVEETATSQPEPTTSTPTTPPQASPQQQQPTRQEPSPRIQALLAERAQRLETMRLAREEAEKAAAAERAKARKQKEAEEAAAKPASSSTSTFSTIKDRSYEAEQAKRKREAKADRERILKQIENDKIARREKEERRRAAAKAMQDGATEEAAQGEQGAMPPRTTSSTTGTSCAIQVRLSSEGSIRNTFPATATIAKDVRSWIASEAGQEAQNGAYTFKLIQPPHPSRPITDAEETQTLKELGLLPSATLIMVSTRGSIASAYPVPGAVGGISGLLRGIFSLILAAIMWFINGLRTLVGPRQTEPSPLTASPDSRAPISLAGGAFRSGAIEAAIARRQAREDDSAVAAAATSSTTGASSSSSSSSSAFPSSAATTGATTGIRIRTLKDQREEKEKESGDRQFYNGNQVGDSVVFEGVLIGDVLTW